MRVHTVTNMTRPRRYAWCRAPLLIVLGICALAIPASANADAVRDWNRHALEALGNPLAPTPPVVPGAAQSPTVTSIHMAMVQGAVYDAVNSIDGGHQPYLAGLPPAPRSASQEAAVATAAHHVLVGLGGGLVPPLPPVVLDRLNALYAAALAGIPEGGDKAAGIAAGAAAAAAMLAAASERRPLRAVLVHGRDRGRRVAPGPAGVRQRPVRMGGQRHAVHPPELFAVPDERPARAQERRLHEGIQRGQGPRRPDRSAVRVPPSRRRSPSSTPSMPSSCSTARSARSPKPKGSPSSSKPGSSGC